MNTRTTVSNNRATVKAQLDVLSRRHIPRRHDFAFLSALYAVLAADGQLDNEEEPPGI